LEDAVLKLWDLNKAVIIQTLSLHFPAFSVLGKEVSARIFKRLWSQGIDSKE
jgi:hypothetical protein